MACCGFQVLFRAASDIQICKGGEMTAALGGFAPSAPPGLVASQKLVGPCSMHVYQGNPAVFDILFIETYYSFPKIDK